MYAKYIKGFRNVAWMGPGISKEGFPVEVGVVNEVSLVSPSGELFVTKNGEAITYKGTLMVNTEGKVLVGTTGEAYLINRIEV